MGYRVTIGDPDDARAVIGWARENCPDFSYQSYDLSDISDNAGYDVILEFVFDNEKDAILFKLRWLG